MIKKRFRSFMPVIIFFIALNAFLISGSKTLSRWGIDQEVVIIGNLLLFLVSFLSFALGLRGLKNPNPHVFVRSVYSSMLIKLFLCAIAVFLYAFLNKNYNKGALFTCMGLYLVYSFMEVSVLMKLLKGKTNE